MILFFPPTITINPQQDPPPKKDVGHGNRYISIHPYFFKAAFLDPRTHHFLRNIMEGDNFHEVC
jgi:hypothetical protein